MASRRVGGEGAGHRSAPSGGAGRRRRPGVVLAAVLLAALAPADAANAAGTLSVRQDAGAITVTCRGDLAWKAVVDRERGGVVRHFSIPDDGPNLVAEELKTDGTVNPFRGMFNAFYMTRIDQGANPEDRVKAKGTLWGKSNGTATIRVVSQTEGEVVVEAKGRGFGWRLIGPPDEAVVEYRQTYTFLPDRVVCDGEIAWVYPHGTRLQELNLSTFFAPGTVAYPLRLTTDDGRQRDLAITSSKGTRLADGVAYPASFDVLLKNGHRLRFRPTRLPEPLREAPWYNFERPWQQQEWAQAFAILGDTESTKSTFPAGEPTRYRYEMQVAGVAPDQLPPRVTITAPAREGAHRLGEAIRFSAKATDAEGRALPGDAIEWALYYPFSRPILRQRGAELSHAIPTDPAVLKGSYVYAVVTATDRSGRTAQDLVKVDVDTHLPRAGADVAFEWSEASPESQGMSSEKLEALWDGLKPSQTKALLVIRNDRVVFERYAEDWGPSRKHYTASMAKALVGGVATAVLVGDGAVKLDDRVATLLPAWRTDPRKAHITLRQLGSHTSGLDDANEEGVPHEKLPGWMGTFWRREAPPNDPFTVSRDLAPVIAEPGTKLWYSNPGIAMLGYALTYVLTDLPQKDLRTLLRDRVMRPIGVADQDWSVGYGSTVRLHGLPLVAAWGGGAYTPRATARVARLMLREGDWEGVRLLAAEGIRQVTRDAGTPGNGGIGWWTNGEGVYRRLPADAYFGAGAGDQLVLVVPSLGLIAVRNGGALQPGPDQEKGREARFFNPLMDAVTGRGEAGAGTSGRPAGAARSPYPPSPVIRGLTWAPAETIRRAAKDSDNWPMTWGDDDLLYTAYGDGTGFVPKVPEKLSLGLARIEGGPDTFVGVNLRSPSAESKGDGRKGRKASGMLMVDGTLYMLARNVGNAQLAWSADHGATWTWADWKLTEGFGCPTFLNFGRNYAGARDDHVYIYSHDSDSAYAPADRLVLARVPRGRVRDRGAYEFFARLRDDGTPEWTADVGRRGAVFSNPGRCYRTSVSYNEGLKRYLLCQTGSDGPVRAGFGIYDAPEPWGPWTTVALTDAWDVPPGESCAFPTKWMSRDGTTLHLVFSGSDSFSVRRATLRVSEGERDRD